MALMEAVLQFASQHSASRFSRCARLWCLCLASATALTCTAAPATAERRVALVIGNSNYQHSTPLKNPRNDASDIAAALTRLGFAVNVGLDLDKAGMDAQLRNFSGKLNGADLALFFYAGHALQVSGTNYLIPVDSRLEAETDIEHDAISLHHVLRHMERQALNNLILLDACRDNPFATRLRRLSRSIAVGEGLATAAGQSVDLLIGFSTNPGAVAADGEGRNSPYAEALLRHMGTPGDEVITTLRRVRNDVYGATSGRQAPWDHNSLRHPIYFNPGRVAMPSAATARPRVVSFKQKWPDGRFTLGSFKRIDAERWTELVQTSNERRAVTYDFRQISASPARVLIHDAHRSTGAMWVRIEIAEKRVYWSSDGQRTWHYLYDVTDVD